MLDVTQVHFLPMFEHLAELLKILITLDEVIGGHTILKEHWTLYKRSASSPEGLVVFSTFCTLALLFRH